VKFVDEALITVRSGDGGGGCVSFSREKFKPRGGPDGGNGGKGGDVIIRATAARRTLYRFRFQRSYQAGNGAKGSKRNKTGKNGSDLIIEIPPGTLVKDNETGRLIKDFIRTGEQFVLARGGRGGQGNARFKTAHNRSPRFAQEGEPGEMLQLKMELQVIADVGIIGYPNAGKSTLISALSSARPKTGSYPFTTLYPTLGVVQSGWGEPFVVADIPGLIEGAHKGAGLGMRFLRHIERTRILIHLIDLATIALDDPLHSYHLINNELYHYHETVARKPQIVVLNKIDLAGTEAAAKAFQDEFKGKNTILVVSALEGQGITALISALVKLLEKSDG
jgi:GTP-binding protein